MGKNEQWNLKNIRKDGNLFHNTKRSLNDEQEC